MSSRTGGIGAWTLDNGLDLQSTQSTEQYVCWTGPSEVYVELEGVMWTMDNGLNLLSTQSTEQYECWTGPSERSVAGGRTV